MEQSPSWEVNRSSDSHEIPCILRNSTVHYHIHNIPTFVPNLSQNNPAHAPPPYPFLKIYFILEIKQIMKLLIM